MLKANGIGEVQLGAFLGTTATNPMKPSDPRQTMRRY